MNFEFTLTRDDLKKSYKQYLFLNYKKVLFFILLLSLFFGYGFSVNPEGKILWNYFFQPFFVSFFAFTLAFFFIPNLIIFFKLRKVKKSILLIINDENITTENPNTSNKRVYNWSETKQIVELKNFYALVLIGRRYLPIPKNQISSDDLKLIKSKIPSQQNSNYKKTSNWVYFLSFIPNVGLFAGLVFLIRGILNKNKKSVLWGVFGILFTPLFWLIFIFITNNTDQYKSSKIQLAKYQLNDIVKDLTYFKSINNTYPDSLGQLSQQNKFFNDIDNSTVSLNPFSNSKPEKFYYQKTSDSTFILKSKGMDKILNTKDDVLPDLK